MWRRAAAAAALAGLWLVATGAADPAGAHAMLRGSDPAGGASLDRSPAAVTLHFTEAPDPALSVVHVLDTAGHAVSTGPAVALAGSRLRAPLPVLGAGTYTVTWRATSRVDGHVSQGAFAFGVGLPAMATPSPNAGAATDVLQGPEPLAVAARWSFFWGIALLLGAAATGLLVFDRRLPARAGPLLGAALALACCGLAVMTIATWASAGVPLGRFLGSGTGHWLEARGGAVLLAAAAVAGLLLAGSGWGAKAPQPVPAASRASATAWLVALGVAASAGLLVHALAGHAAAPGPLRLVNLGSQWLHLLAAALLSELPPGSDAPGARAATPPQPAVVRASGADYTTAVRVTLQVSPGSAGPNRFVATVADYDTGRTLLADHVRLSATLPARPDVAAAELDLTRAADGSWHGQGAVLTIAGTWAITTLVERPDDGVEVPIELHVGASPVS